MICEVIDECGEICENDPNCKISEWAVQSEPMEIDPVEEMKIENEKLKTRILDLETKNTELETQIRSLQTQLTNAQAIIMEQLNVILQTLDSLKSEN